MIFYTGHLARYEEIHCPNCDSCHKYEVDYDNDIHENLKWKLNKMIITNFECKDCKMLFYKYIDYSHKWKRGVKVDSKFDKITMIMYKTMTYISKGVSQ